MIRHLPAPESKAVGCRPALCDSQRRLPFFLAAEPAQRPAVCKPSTAAEPEVIGHVRAVLWQERMPVLNDMPWM